MKWRYLDAVAVDHTQQSTVHELATVEALRAIAEQLEAMNSELVVIAAELIKQNEREAER